MPRSLRESLSRVHTARVLQLAIKLQQQGRLYEAEQLYRAILERGLGALAPGTAGPGAPT
jgi:hypothetical protein